MSTVNRMSIAARPDPGTESVQARSLVQERRILLAVSGCSSVGSVAHAADLASAMRATWYAVHIETPEDSSRAYEATAAEALATAASAGASVATVSASDVVEGLAAHAQDLAITDLVIGQSKPHWWTWRPSVARRLALRNPDLFIHLLPSAGAGRAEDRSDLAIEPSPRASGDVSSGRALLYSAGLVLITGLLGEPVRALGGARSVDLLFLLPVITTAVQFGVGVGVATALLSVLLYDTVFLQQLGEVRRAATQTGLMAGALIGVALYTGALSNRLRLRTRLSDRSARENAAIVAFAQELARASDWPATAEIVCREVGALLDVRTALVREKAGGLVIEAAMPPHAQFGPIDRAALDWAWEQGKESGIGTTHLAAADWQFHPLATSVGMLAILAIARDDGRNPIPATRAVLLSTLIAQAALAHERLRLEDRSVRLAVEQRDSPRT